MRADVREAVELTPDVEHPDLAPPDLHHPAGPLLDMLQGEPPGHITVRGQGPGVSLTRMSQSTTRIFASLSLRSFCLNTVYAIRKPLVPRLWRSVNIVLVST